MNDQDADPSNGQDIQRQFALLQGEMKRAMAAPPAATAASAAADDGAGELRRLETGIADLRRDADRLRERLAPTAEDPALVTAVADLRTRMDAVAAQVAAVGKRTEDNVAWLGRSLQTTLQTLDDLGLRVDALARRRPSRWMVPLAILLGALAIGVAVVASVPGRAQMLIDRVHTLAFPDKPHAELAPPPPPTPTPKTAEAAPVPPAPVPPAAEPTPPSVAGVAPVAPPVLEPPPPAPAVAEAPATPAIAAPSPPPTPALANQVVIRAKADTWIEVRNREGAALVQRVFHAGETWPVPDGDSLVLTTGNAGGVDLLVDGTPAPPLGASGVIRREVPLDPALVRAGHYSQDQPTKPKPSAASR